MISLQLLGSILSILPADPDYSLLSLNVTNPHGTLNFFTVNSKPIVTTIVRVVTLGESTHAHERRKYDTFMFEITLMKT